MGDFLVYTDGANLSCYFSDTKRAIKSHSWRIQHLITLCLCVKYVLGFIGQAQPNEASLRFTLG